MASFLQYLKQAQDLTTLKDPDTEAMVEALLGQLLLVEGPPVDPIPGVSEEQASALVRSPKGRPWFMATTWTTGPWRCLLLEIPSVPMGRPITLKSAEGQAGPGRTILDSRSQKFQLRTVMACQQLGIATPVGEGAVHAVFGSHRTFLAWRQREDDEPMNRALRGDSDNFAKNALDGLQRAGVLPNDKGVFRLTATKDAPGSWEQPPTPMEEALRLMALNLHAKGEPFETIRVELRLSQAHMTRIFPDYKTPRSHRAPKDPATGHGQAKLALELILQGKSYNEARQETGAPAALLRERLAAHLRPRILEGKVTPQVLAQELSMDARTLSGIFKHDKEARKALRLAAEAAQKAGRPHAKGKAQKALDKALKDVLEKNISVAVAASEHHVNANSLASKVQRAKKALKTSPPAGPDAPPKAPAPKPSTKASAKPKKKPSPKKPTAAQKPKAKAEAKA